MDLTVEELYVEEAKQTMDRWEDQQARIRLREGGGTTEAARAIAEAYISRVVAQVPERPSGG